MSTRKGKAKDELLQWKKSQEHNNIFLMWVRERLFQVLGVVSLCLCAVLFLLQSYLAFRSYRMMHELNTKRVIPETLYHIYFDGDEQALDREVDLRANTTLYMH